MKPLVWWLLKHEQFVFYASRVYFLLCWITDLKFDRCHQLLWRVRNYTLVSYPRLRHLWNLLDLLEREKIDGAYVECGVWRGGSAAVIAYHAQQERLPRTVHLFDSWEGMPEPTEHDGGKARFFSESKTDGALKRINKTVSPLGHVKEILFSRLHLKKTGLFFHKGWFQHTIAKRKRDIGPIALLRIDADWYESIKLCLDELYARVVPGGAIIFDDYYYWPGAKKAVDEFLKGKTNHTPLDRIDTSGAWIRIRKRAVD